MAVMFEHGSTLLFLLMFRPVRRAYGKAGSSAGIAACVSLCAVRDLRRKICAALAFDGHVICVTTSQMVCMAPRPEDDKMAVRTTKFEVILDEVCRILLAVMARIHCSCWKCCRVWPAASRWLRVRRCLAPEQPSASWHAMLVPCCLRPARRTHCSQQGWTTLGRRRVHFRRANQRCQTWTDLRRGR